MKISFGPAIAAAALMAMGACAHGSNDTKTASTETTAAQPQGSGGDTTASGSKSAGTDPSASGTSGTATAQGGVSGTTGSATAPTDSSSGTMGKSGSATSGSMGGNTGSTSGSDTSTVGNDKPSTEPSPAGSMPSGSADGKMGSGGDVSSDPSGAQASLRSVTGSVSKIDAQSQSITLDQAAGNLTLTVDATTRVWRNGRPLLGIQSIREGQKVRASFDPASNRASKIEVMGGKPRGSSKSDQ